MILCYNTCQIGVSSSGKTKHFDCFIRWFESSYPSYDAHIRTIRLSFECALFLFHSLLTNIVSRAGLL